MKKNKLNVLCFIIFLAGVIALQAQKQTVVTKIGRNNTAGIENYFNAALAPFYHGVASGDPLKDAVIIWTRVTTNQPDVNVTWKVATNASMTNVVKQGLVVTDERKDYTVKVDVRSLQPNTTYYFQFEALGKKSEIGKTRTSPTGNVSNVRFGVVSCSNYQNGYFNAYEEMADRTDIDAVIHLGDYIYEYETGGYGYSDEVGRGHLPNNEIVTLSDYRVRYSYYRLDPMLRKLHQQHPFILVWDDHEFSNDANKFGAENHDPATEGSWETRKNNAYKAYFEWMPVRANSIQEYRLYRDFSYGNLADLLMLDTRIEGRDETVSTTQKLNKSSKKDLQSKVKTLVANKSLQSIEDFENAIKEIAPYFIQEGKLTGEELRYVIQKFAQVAYNYKNNGSRSLSSKEDQSKLKNLLVKATTVDSKLAGRATYESILGQAQFNWLLNKLSTSSATWKIIGNQVMMMNYNGVPTNDAWDGYEEERERLYQHISNNNINNVVVLTGDIHSTFAGDLKYGRECIGAEFVVPSVTSQNLDAFGGIATGLAEFYTKLLNRHMKEVDLDEHGYFVLDVKEERVQADWFYIRDVKVPNSGEFYHKGYYVNKNGCGIRATNTPANATSRYGDQPEPIENSIELLEEGAIIMGVYPNPMQTSGNVHYLLQNPTELSIVIFNSNGQKVKDVLINKKQEIGIYNVNFDVESLAAGNYFLKVKAGNKTITKQFIVR
ncbi:alkaline phosphatase D [Tenacibaculum skagerrakense]|uniref:Alkaline phosphatase D n=1 Tax=Tenacibaculum skagerrakense TaxID=186571 RepID=A0A4R2P262_9FLAO|nr:alkaline phosphatase D family protein [Tenacibaculum skagerrakense]TCP28627.1 alkaline phosphatase D [Tenacibaculum skagerrakense]